MRYFADEVPDQTRDVEESYYIAFRFFPGFARVGYKVLQQQRYTTNSYSNWSEHVFQQKFPYYTFKTKTKNVHDVTV